MTRFGTLALILGLVACLASACGTSSHAIGRPFAALGGTSSGPNSGLWGDGSSGPTGMHIGCIDGRRLAVLITVRNRTTRGVTLVSGTGQQPASDVIDLVAVQVLLAPPPPKGDLFQSSLRSWSGQSAAPIAIPTHRAAWVQLNFLMRHCNSLGSHETVVANQSLTLTYRSADNTGTEVVSVPGARIILTRGPVHPSLPINQTG